MDILQIVIRASVVYISIVLAIRILGKSEVAQLNVSDLVFILLISNAVQNAMVGDDTSLLGGLIAATVLFIMNRIFKEILYRSPKLSEIMQGSPIILVYKGNINNENMKKARLRESDLLEALRGHGLNKVSEAEIVVLEVSGNISVIERKE